MPEKEVQFFRKQETKEKQEKPIERLQSFIGEMSSGLKKDGIPVNEKGRIDMDQFGQAFPGRIIERDKVWVKDLRDQWNRAAVSGSKWSWIFSKEQILQQKTVGDVWEMLATAVLHKNLGKDFIVVRTSEYDDAKNGVDSLIIDRESGSVICAFDEVGVVSGQRFNEKIQKVLERNWRHGGADIEYGISFVEKQGERWLRKGRISHIPLFYFATSEVMVKKALELFSKDSTSPKEQEIFKGFIDSFTKQIDDIKKGPMHPKFKERLEFFESILSKLKDAVKPRSEISTR